MTGSVRFERDGALAAVVLDAPDRLNAIGESMWIELKLGFEVLAGDEGLRCVVVRGAGGNFAAGADIEEFERIRFDESKGRQYHLETIANALAAIERCKVPIIAAIQGVCVGGGLELAVACDLRIAADGARIGAPVGRIGFPFALPELVPLLKLIGPAACMELLVEGRLLTAREAFDRGLVTRAVAASDFEQEIRETIIRIAAGSPRAARENKANIRRLSASNGLYTERELDDSFGFLESADYREGVKAFLAKRPPQFEGR